MLLLRETVFLLLLGILSEAFHLSKIFRSSHSSKHIDDAALVDVKSSSVRSSLQHGTGRCKNLKVYDSVQILDTLLNQAADIAIKAINESAHKNQSHDQINYTAAPKLYNLPLSFSSHYSMKLLFNQSEIALSYLSLPANQYSVLNSSIIAKSVNDDNTFLLRLPLRDFANALDSVSPSFNIRALSKYFLSTSVQVNPTPREGKITMQSGPFYFKPEDTVVDSKLKLIDNINDTYSIEKIMSKDILPTWLQWGAAEQNVSSNIVDGDIGVKSSLQPSLLVRLSWDPKALAHNPHQNQNTWGDALKKIKIWKSDHGTDVLKVKLHVDVKVDINLPVSRRVGKVVDGTPLKYLVPYIGSTVIFLFLKEIVPPFSKLLLNDYELRKVKIAQSKLAEQGSIV